MQNSTPSNYLHGNLVKIPLLRPQDPFLLSLLGLSHPHLCYRMVCQSDLFFLNDLKLTFFRYCQASNPRLAGLNTLKYSVWISRGSALVLTVDAALILLPMCRNLLRWIRPMFKWLPLDESIWFHRQVAYSMLIFSIIHVAGHYVK